MKSMRLLAPLLVVLAAGCNTPGHVRAVKTADRLDDLAFALEDLRTRTSETSVALTALVAAKDQDPAAAFQRFDTSVDAFASARRRVESRMHAVRAEADAYFLAWREQAAQITDADLKEHAEERRGELAKSVDKVEESLKPVRETLDSYGKSLDDTLKYLSIDLTPQGIQTVEGRAKSAGKTVKSLDEDLADALQVVRKAAPQFAAARASTPTAHKSASPADDEHSGS